ncbi:Molybdopterin biosynthesis MoaE [Rhizopus microsporus var. microsporus]|uniref:Molybdopterin synthase catalytic subunit n=2 Tax=Rhizopus microsporus TaxID=58291 RepID=A0A2G4T4I1_RHIZD|nr:Molybdopterin biosynthesis MoaE [Rhizopus microsporus ATCC 52813]ORE04105.1 Molybdopterin biosynthesis MoaE [Rhizopus microsporus var. microsporus]PHZ15586.1 Molybdopterin biosynthesis MoaE [Rhizopus microsporus ATCC 52813]
MTKDTVVITHEGLPLLDDIVKIVQDDSAGAISTFSGTTRDTFEGKKVVQLDYEAYEPMAKKVLLDIIQKARSKWSLKHIAIYHRTGTVPVGEVSVVIAVSSAHRGDSIHAMEYLIDELKETCPIWKREVYEDGSVWKGACCTSKIGH